MQHTQIEEKAIPEGCKLLEMGDHFLALKDKFVQYKRQVTRVGFVRREFRSLQL